MAPPTRLTLIRHGPPDIRKGQPSAEWELRRDAHAEVVHLARALPPAPLITASDEPKALQTAEIIQTVVGGRLRVEPQLREVTRPDTWLPDYERHAARYLAGEQQPGWEPADDVLDRVTQAMSELPTGTAVVGHGLSLTLYTVSRTAFDHVAFWRALHLPDAWIATDGAAPRRVEAPRHR